MKRIIAFLAALILWIAMIAASCQAAVTVDLAWDPSLDTNATGYIVYWGPIAQTLPLRMPVGTNLTAVITGLQPGVTYDFYVTAHDDLGQESDPSNVVTYAVPDENHAPSLDPLTNVVALIGQTVTLTACASDVDTNQTLHFSLTEAPAGAVIDQKTGAFAWTTLVEGVYPVTIMVIDDGLPMLADSSSFLITVTAPMIRLMTFLESSTKDPKDGPWTTEKAFEEQAYPAGGQKFYRTRMEVYR